MTSSRHSVRMPGKAGNYSHLWLAQRQATLSVKVAQATHDAPLALHGRGGVRETATTFMIWAVSIKVMAVRSLWHQMLQHFVKSIITQAGSR